MAILVLTGKPFNVLSQCTKLFARVQIGQHIGSRLVELGCDTFFTVPGDFNLGFLDELLKEPCLKMVSTCCVASQHPQALAALSTRH